MLSKPKTKLYFEWQQFHSENPRVYELVDHYAQQVIARGYRKYGIATIWERMRWHLTVDAPTAHEFKLPNNHRAYYARYWMELHPQYPEFFSLHRLRSEHEDVPGEKDRYGRYPEELFS